MTLMRDEMFDRDYQWGRAELNAGIDRALAEIGRTVGDSLKVLHHIEWSAPWNARTNRRAGRA
jgi:hypothetical protein